jgi:hypothetical protein
LEEIFMKNVFVSRSGVLLFGLLGIAALSAQDAPLWLTRRGAVYPPEQYVAGVGEGGTAEEARTRALAQISQFFRTKVGDTTTLLYTYNDDITIEAQDGTPLVTYTKKYPLFRHVTREEALARALRNIEQDLGGEFAKEAGRIGE